MADAKVKTSLASPLKILRKRLSGVGVKTKYLNEVVLPAWWENSIADTQAGLREAAGYVCARLGFSLASLLNEDAPLAYASSAGVRYKKPKDKSAEDVKGATQLALGLARAVAQAYVEAPQARSVPAPTEWRELLLNSLNRKFVRLRDILDAAWDLGIPVVQVTKIPAGIKKPDALATMVGERPVIVVFCARKSPAWIAFIVAHELGHIFNGHVKSGETLVDEHIDGLADDEDERAANEFAMRLLTGRSDLGFHPGESLGPRHLMAAAINFGKDQRVSAGVAALNYGFLTKQWSVAIKALSGLERGEDACADLARACKKHLPGEELSDDTREWIERATNERE